MEEHDCRVELRWWEERSVTCFLIDANPCQINRRLRVPMVSSSFPAAVMTAMLHYSDKRSRIDVCRGQRCGSTLHVLKIRARLGRTDGSRRHTALRTVARWEASSEFCQPCIGDAECSDCKRAQPKRQNFQDKTAVQIGASHGCNVSSQQPQGKERQSPWMPCCGVCISTRPLLDTAKWGGSAVILHMVSLAAFSPVCARECVVEMQNHSFQQQHPAS